MYICHAKSMRIDNMTKEQILKLKAVVLYIINKCGEIDFIHLFKILYFAERKQYAEYGQHLVYDSFCALERGPVPSFLYDAVKNVAGLKYTSHNNMDILTNALASGSGECHYMLRATQTPDMDELSEAEIEALDCSIAENIHKDISTLSSDSHDEAWRQAWEKSHNSPMDVLMIAKAGGASDDFIEYIRENEMLENYIKG